MNVTVTMQVRLTVAERLGLEDVVTRVLNGVCPRTPPVIDKLLKKGLIAVERAENPMRHMPTYYLVTEYGRAVHQAIMSSKGKKA